MTDAPAPAEPGDAADEVFEQKAVRLAKRELVRRAVRAVLDDAHGELRQHFAT